MEIHFSVKRLANQFFVTIFVIKFARTFASQVFDLDEWNWDQFTKDKDVMLVEFFAPW